MNDRLRLQQRDSVLALVSGLPRPRWEAWRFMVMQAFVDDSGSDLQDRFFILAGFVASPDQWLAFTADWQKALDSKPRLEYFKSNEAYGLKDQFDKNRGWTEEKRDRRIVDLAAVIQKHVPERFSVAVGNKEFERCLGGIPIRNRVRLLDNPYFWLFCQLMLIVAAFHSTKKNIDRCNFIFDDQGKVGEQSRKWWNTFKQGALRTSNFDFTPFLGSPPTFESDICFPPLQAADLLAGQIRRQTRSEKIIILPSTAQRILDRMSGIFKIYGLKELMDARNDMLRYAAAVEKKEPGSLRHVTGRRKRAKKPSK